MSLRTALGMALALAGGAFGFPDAAPALTEETLGFEITPPRLSYTDGAVSFLRPGADDWTPARVNTALAAGDELYTDQGANLELQIGSRAYLRAGEQTQLGLASLEPDYLQFRLTSGHAALDLRSLQPGQTFEVATPNAAFTVERAGYYRIEVGPDATRFTSRRGGHANVTLANGESATLGGNEQLVVEHGNAPSLARYAAPELDAWDRWNYARTDAQLDAVSRRYVSSDVYGADQLDQYGDWRTVPTYGSVWVPRNVGPGWVPYSTGIWMHDPYYGWTWVDDAPWGWAPYHYGRWVYVSGFWGWYPGPLVTRAYYAPALVAFFGGGLAYSVRPTIGWVALGYGEPLYPWWGPVWFRSKPCWVGWHGPRSHHWAHHDAHRHDGHGHGGHGHGGVRHDGDHDRGRGDHDRDRWDRYQNARVKDAIVATDRDRFGRRARDRNFWRASREHVQPLERDPGIAPDPSSRVADARRGRRPPEAASARSVVATRTPQAERGFVRDDRRESWRGESWRPVSASRRARGDAPDAAKAAAPARPTPTRVAARSRDAGRGEPARSASWRRDAERRSAAPAAPDVAPRSARAPREIGPERSARNAAPERWRGSPSWTRRPAPPASGDALAERTERTERRTSERPPAGRNERAAAERWSGRGSRARGESPAAPRIEAPRIEAPRIEAPRVDAAPPRIRSDPSPRIGGGRGDRGARIERAPAAAPRAPAEARRSGGGGGGRRDSGAKAGSWNRGEGGGKGSGGGWQGRGQGGGRGWSGGGGRGR